MECLLTLGCTRDSEKRARIREGIGMILRLVEVGGGRWEMGWGWGWGWELFRFEISSGKVERLGNGGTAAWQQGAYHLPRPEIYLGRRERKRTLRLFLGVSGKCSSQ
jgi:hypothetical protein